MNSTVSSCKGFFLLLLALWLGHTAFLRSEAPLPPAVEYEGGLFVELKMLEAFGFQFSAVKVMSTTVDVQCGEKKWQFQTGGDRISRAKEKPVLLHHPMLVLEGRLYLHQKDAWEHFQLRLDAESLSFQGQTIAHQPRKLVSKHRKHRVEGLEPRNAAVELQKRVPARVSLQTGKAPVMLEPAQIFLVRRSCRVDGVDYLLMTRTGPNPESLLVRAGEVEGALADASLAGTCWERRWEWFQERARKDGAFRRAESGDSEVVAVTVDLCWSMRTYETAFFEQVAREAGEGRKLAFTPFLSGRWMEQHPLEMESLIHLGETPGVELTWGLHSWSHPKTGDFMNDMSLAQVIEDTLKLESFLLTWGIVPTVYYRFPGLIHNPARLRTVLSLGLLSIDCDAWVAEYAPRTRHPFGGPTRGGSVMLIHGNGNEPQGVERILEWWKDHQEWTWEPLYRFLPDS